MEACEKMTALRNKTFCFGLYSDFTETASSSTKSGFKK